MYRLLTSTDDEYESGFVRNQGNRDGQLKGDCAAAERGHMYIMIVMSDLFVFLNDCTLIVQKVLIEMNNVGISFLETKFFYKNVLNATKFLIVLGMESGMERFHYILFGFEYNNVSEQTDDASNFDKMNVI